MRKLEADILWGKACVGYHIQAHPDQATAEALLQVQRKFVETSPVALHVVPPTSLHVSVVTLVAPQLELHAAEEDWLRVSSNLNDQLKDIARHSETVSIVFPRLALTRQAAIVVTDEQPDVFINLRSRFERLLESAGLPSRKYDQTHVTIARFAENRCVDFGALASNESINLLGRFDRIRLVRERRYPSLEIEVL